MLGDSLLVAPIFNPEGIGEFYLPEGSRWTNYLDGEELEGGRWYRRKYDYFHMPLFVKNGTILPVGSNDQRPDYEYTEGLELFIPGPEEGVVMKRRVLSLDGTKELMITAELKDGQPHVEKRK